MRPSLTSLVFAFLEDGTLRVFPSKSAAAVEFEGVDVESGTVAFYDANGTFLEPQFTSPNKSGRLLGSVGWVASGEYELSQNESAEVDPFSLALLEVQVLEPNEWFASLEDLKLQLRANGVDVEYPGPQGTREA